MLQSSDVEAFNSARKVCDSRIDWWQWMLPNWPNFRPYILGQSYMGTLILTSLWYSWEYLRSPAKKFAILCRVSGWLAMYRRPQGPQCREDVQFTQPHLSEFVTVAIWLGIMVGPGWFMSELLAFVWKNLWWPTTDQILCFCKHTKRSQKHHQECRSCKPNRFPHEFSTAM